MTLPQRDGGSRFDQPQLYKRGGLGRARRRPCLELGELGYTGRIGDRP